MTEWPYVLTADLREKLAALGWFPGRRVEVKEKLAKVEEAGWKVFPVAQAFVEQFEGLGEHSDHFMDVEDAGTEWRYTEEGFPYAEYEADTSTKLFPIGVWNGWVLLIIDEQGRIYGIYGTDKEDIQPLGDDPQSAFEDLVNAIYRTRIIRKWDSPLVTAKLSTETLVRLEAHGWLSRERADVKGAIAEAEAKGWCSFRLAENFLSIFDGFTTVTEEEIYKEAWRAVPIGADDHAPLRKLRDEETIFPIGLAAGWVNVLLTDKFEVVYSINGSPHPDRRTLDSLINQMISQREEDEKEQHYDS